ncbi:MAG TPA: YcaO-like family protein [Ktedonobacteraceae bacterium]|nr:YcaO-like family protein [Ktedonobacteraceae bacterium]
MLELKQTHNEEENQAPQRQGEKKEKAITLGTHRVCPPEETLARIRPLLPSMGITRVADLTRLDDLGLPVVQAIRPNSRNLSVSQGKGVTKALATASALMESIELWHAEEPELPAITHTPGEMKSQLPYSIYDLNLSPHYVLHDRLPLKWFPAQFVESGEKTWIPASYVQMNMLVTNSWILPTFAVTSNGLASGNIREEAILHGLYEVIERDTLVGSRTGSIARLYIDPATVDGHATVPILERFYRAGATVEIQGLVGPTGIACFEVHLSSPSYPRVIAGFGCHLDRDVALSRALTEAAQIRLSIIAGSRDDIQHGAYAEIQQMRSSQQIPQRAELVHFHVMPSISNQELATDLQEVIRRVCSVVSCPPFFVDLTRSEFGIPVVFVVIPQFRMVEDH